MNTSDKREPVDAYLKRIFGEDIKPGAETRRLQEDTAFAGDLAKRLDAEPLPEGVAAPITSAVPTTLAPVKYIIHVWTHRCSMCQTEHKHSEVYALNHLRSRTGAGTWVRNMTPVAKLEWQVPIDVIPVTTRITAGCFECLDALREHVLPTLPKPPVPEAVLKAPAPEGAAGPARPQSGGKSKTPTTTGSAKPTTDDFIV